MENPFNELDNTEVETNFAEEDSPLVAALRQHLTRYYDYAAGQVKPPFSSRNQVILPLNLDLCDASSIQEMCKARSR